MTQAWFRWEMDHACRWCPAVFYGDRPKASSDRVTGAIEVPADCLSDDGSPIFGKLQRRFPPPKEAT